MTRASRLITTGTMLAALALGACDTVDCALNNTVTCNYAFYDESGTPVQLAGVLTITAAGTDSVLLNQKAQASSFSLPMSHWQDADVLTFTISGNGYEIQDRVVVEKENTAHFESPDCPATMFHGITRASSTHNFIDTVIIASPAVNYNGKENIQIRLHTDD